MWFSCAQDGGPQIRRRRRRRSDGCRPLLQEGPDSLRPVGDSCYYTAESENADEDPKPGRPMRTTDHLDDA
jgi:hypothetical protein